MAAFIRNIRRSDEDPDVNLIPIMNIFLVIIPFLLTSVSFFHIKAISTSVPVMADSSQASDKPQQEVKLTVIMEMQPAGMRLSATSTELSPDVLDQYDQHIKREAGGRYPLEELKEYLQFLKGIYPASDTLILVPDNTVKYEAIIHAMDAARNFNHNPLFPNVVLSGSLG